MTTHGYDVAHYEGNVGVALMPNPDSQAIFEEAIGFAREILMWAEQDWGAAGMLDLKVPGYRTTVRQLLVRTGRTIAEIERYPQGGWSGDNAVYHAGRSNIATFKLRARLLDVHSAMRELHRMVGAAQAGATSNTYNHERMKLWRKHR